MRLTLLVFLALFVFFVAGGAFYTLGTGDNTEVIIENTETKITGSGDNTEQKYLIFTDKGVFENTDSLWRLKFDSSDLYGLAMRLRGKRAKIYYYGLRIPFFSAYPNIYKIEPLD